MKNRLIAFVALGLLADALATAETAAPKHPPTPYPARVSTDGRSLIDQFGAPFFYLGDTAWELFHRLDREQAETYLNARAAQRFTVIQAVVLAEYGGLDVPNAYGQRPLVDHDPTRLVEAYFEHVDFIVDRAERLGLAVGLLPTWGDKWNKKWGQGPEIFTPENAGRFGESLGRRYREKPIVWILGGDRPVENDRHKAIIRAMAEGVQRGDGGRHLITFHPSGGSSSAQWFHDDPWLALNMIQSGHGRDHENHARIAADYARVPAKPCLDGEPGYEDHPAEFDPKNGYLDDTDVRKYAYWSLFAGACGHTYGCHDIWQFYDLDRKPITAARTPWREALRRPGAGQMRHVRALLESRPLLSRVPDQSLIASDLGRGGDHVQAARDRDGSYAFLYVASGRAVTVDLAKLTGSEVRASWFDPRQGTAEIVGTYPRTGRRVFTPPSSGLGRDWVLVLDDASKGFPLPGETKR